MNSKQAYKKAQAKVAKAKIRLEKVRLKAWTEYEKTTKASASLPVHKS